ncbi:hypothetical protein D4Z78_06400 [Okeania hirsuta]|nr:hypothetical protein D4Z78_06400 [Okeania hirsuta]
MKPQKNSIAGNREQGTGNREQGTGQGTGNREQGTGNREQGTGGKTFPCLRFIISLCPNQLFLCYSSVGQLSINGDKSDTKRG